MCIDFEKIIKSLYTGELTEYQKGYNDALISVLQSTDMSKYFGGLKDFSELTPLEKFEFIMKKHGYSDLLVTMGGFPVDSIIRQIEYDRRVIAVKILRDNSRLEIKKCKEIIEELAEAMFGSE